MLLFVIILVSFLFLFVSIRFLPFRINIRTFASFSYVERWFISRCRLLSFPFVQSHGFGFLFFGSLLSFVDFIGCVLGVFGIFGFSRGIVHIFGRNVGLVIFGFNFVLESSPVMRSASILLIDGLDSSFVISGLAVEITFATTTSASRASASRSTSSSSSGSSTSATFVSFGIKWGSRLALLIPSVVAFLTVFTGSVCGRFAGSVQYSFAFE